MALAPGVGLAVAGLWLRYPGGGLSRSSADEYLAFHAASLGSRHVAPMVAAVHARQRWRDGSRRSVDLPGRDDRLDCNERWRVFSWCRPQPALVEARRYRRDLQGAGDRCDLRDRSAVPGGPRAGCCCRVDRAAAATCAVDQRTTRCSGHGAPPFSFVDLRARVLGLLPAAPVFGDGPARRSTCRGLGHPVVRPRAGRDDCRAFAIGAGSPGNRCAHARYGVSWALAPDVRALLLACCAACWHGAAVRRRCGGLSCRWCGALLGRASGGVGAPTRFPRVGSRVPRRGYRSARAMCSSPRQPVGPVSSFPGSSRPLCRAVMSRVGTYQLEPGWPRER